MHHFGDRSSLVAQRLPMCDDVLISPLAVNGVLGCMHTFTHTLGPAHPVLKAHILRRPAA
jgi:hypothetical protein